MSRCGRKQMFASASSKPAESRALTGPSRPPSQPSACETSQQPQNCRLQALLGPLKFCLSIRYWRQGRCQRRSLTALISKQKRRRSCSHQHARSAEISARRVWRLLKRRICPQQRPFDKTDEGLSFYRRISLHLLKTTANYSAVWTNVSPASELKSRYVQSQPVCFLKRQRYEILIGFS